MVAALRLGIHLGVTPPATGERVLALLERLELPVDLDAQPLGAALRWVDLDKKRQAGGVRFVLLRGIGDATVVSCTREQLTTALAAS